ncbi:hypothetical protein [Corallococcus aberystwythensis]|uniref:Uncharacterized protein n=1 Tax=Corallococcus aberystwythensis TaxID=2316722 RepID=A0A3A8Q7J7_9BACT|nr:hypothetical protein [Corallococcus aberystwythensis]RKH64118.1 hypothetical protein D7W81_19155 [Corallococcus aberystwythensis]
MLLGHRLKQRFGLARLLGVNDRGQEDFSAPKRHACRFEGSTKRLVTTDGTDATSEAVLFTIVEVGPGDAVWLPGATPGDLNTRRRPLRVTPCFDIRGTLDHYEVYV